MSKKNFCIALVLAFVSLSAQAQSSSPPAGGTPPGGQGGGRHRGPPPQAVEACQGKPSGSTCSFVGRRNNTVSGTCSAPQADMPLACHGAGGGPGMGSGSSGSGGQTK